MNRKSTANYYVADGFNHCSYCHEEIFPYDIFDEYGGYVDQYYQCNCEKAQIEMQMNDEIIELENKIQDIKHKYSDQLHIDEKLILKEQKEAEIRRIEERYSYFDNLNE